MRRAPDRRVLATRPDHGQGGAGSGPARGADAAPELPVVADGGTGVRPRRRLGPGARRAMAARPPGAAPRRADGAVDPAAPPAAGPGALPGRSASGRRR